LESGILPLLAKASLTDLVVFAGLFSAIKDKENATTTPTISKMVETLFRIDYLCLCYLRTI
jgi:hypothetical protein